MARRRRGKRLLLVPVAAFWLALLACVAVMQLAGPLTANAAPPANSPLNILLDTPTPIPTATTTAPTPTLTPTQPAKTATPLPKPTATTPPSTGGGGSQTGGGGSQAPQPTKVVLAQPTAGASGDNSLQGVSFSDGINGVWLASGFGCITALLGLLVAFVALSSLVRGGYGPFLRAVLLGSKAAAKDGKNGTNAKASAATAGRDEWDLAEDDWNQPPRNGARNAPSSARGRSSRARLDDDDYDPRPSVARMQGTQARVRSQAAQRPRGRSRPDW